MSTIFRSSGFRYASLLALLATVVALFLYYQNIRDHKAAVIQLASINFYEGNEFTRYEGELDYFARLKGSWFLYRNSPDFESFLEAINQLRAVEGKLEGQFFEDLIDRIWKDKSLTPFDYHDDEINISKEQVDEFYRATATYIKAFEVVLMQTEWIAQAGYPKGFPLDTIRINTDAARTALHAYKDKFTKTGFVTLNERQFDLSHITRFEIRVMMDRIHWLRAKAEHDYVSVVSAAEKKWIAEASNRLTDIKHGKLP